MADAPSLTVVQPWSPSKGGLVDLGIDGTSPSGSPFSITGNGTFTFPCAGAGSVWLEFSAALSGASFSVAFSGTQSGAYQVAPCANNTLRQTSLSLAAIRVGFNVQGPWCQVTITGYTTGSSNLTVTFSANPAPLYAVTLQPPSANTTTPTENPVYIAGIDTSGHKQAPLTDTTGQQYMIQGGSRSLNVSAATLVKSGAGRLVRISVIVAGSAAGAVYDSASTGAVGTSNQVFVIPNTVGVYLVDWPIVSGIVAAPGTGQTVAVSYQ